MNPHTPTDAEIISASCENPERFGEIFDRHGSSVLVFLRRRIHPDECENALQDIFRIAFTKRASFDTTRPSCLPWLYGIAHNVVYKSKRSFARKTRAYERFQNQAFHDVTIVDQPIIALENAERWARTRDALKTFSIEDQQTILLYAWEELSYAEIAVVLNKPLGTIRSRLHRIRTQLNELLEPTGENDYESTTPLERHPS